MYFESFKRRFAASYRDNITIQPFKGCLKNLKLKNDNLLTAEQVGISKGCPEQSLVGL